MKKLLNTLYVTSENSYLGLEGETIVVYDNQMEIGRLPLHNLDSIVSFGYRGTSPALMGACAEHFYLLFESTRKVLGKSIRKNKRKCFFARATI